MSSGTNSLSPPNSPLTKLNENYCFNLNFSNPGSDGPARSLLLSPQPALDEMEESTVSALHNFTSASSSTVSMGGLGSNTVDCGENSGLKMPRAKSSANLLPNGKKTKGRVKIKMEYIGNKLRRYTTFSKRKTGIMKKAHELSTLTGTQVMLLVASETGHVYAFATHKLKPMIASEQGKTLIQHCLNAPDHDGEQIVAEMADGAMRTEFTFEPPPGANLLSALPRKRKIAADECINFPTMVASSSAGNEFLTCAQGAEPSSSGSPFILDESFCGESDESDKNEIDEMVEDEMEEMDERATANHHDHDDHIAPLGGDFAANSPPKPPTHTKRLKVEGAASHAEKRAKQTPKPMKWTTQTISPPSAQFAPSSSSTNSANSATKQRTDALQLQRTLKEALRVAADQRQRQNNFKNSNGNLPFHGGYRNLSGQQQNTSSSHNNASNDNNKRRVHGNNSNNNNNGNNNMGGNVDNNGGMNNGTNQLLFQQQLSAILPIMLQAAAFGNSASSSPSNGANLQNANANRAELTSNFAIGENDNSSTVNNCNSYCSSGNEENDSNASQQNSLLLGFPFGNSTFQQF